MQRRPLARQRWFLLAFASFSLALGLMLLFYINTPRSSEVIAAATATPTPVATTTLVVQPTNMPMATNTPALTGLPALLGSLDTTSSVRIKILMPTCIKIG